MRAVEIEQQTRAVEQPVRPGKRQPIAPRQSSIDDSPGAGREKPANPERGYFLRGVAPIKLSRCQPKCWLVTACSAARAVPSSEKLPRPPMGRYSSTRKRGAVTLAVSNGLRHTNDIGCGDGGQRISLRRKHRQRVTAIIQFGKNVSRSAPPDQGVVDTATPDRTRLSRN